MIEGVTMQKMDIFSNEQGAVYKMLRSDAPYYKGFGEVYFSQTFPGVIKAWKQHLKTIQNLLVIQGENHFVMCDYREFSPTKGTIQEVTLNISNFLLIQIPPGVVYGWKAGVEGSLMANCIDQPYFPEESKNLPLSSIPYTWS